MRRLVKESPLQFDGTPLFPERRAYSPTYKLSEPEVRLYKEVTGYFREEFNGADKLEQGRKGTVGFALTILQRRLARSPEARLAIVQVDRERAAGPHYLRRPFTREPDFGVTSVNYALDELLRVQEMRS